jgi:hypothetical protein
VPDTTAHTSTATLTGIGALLAGLGTFWHKINGTAVLRATVEAHTLELADHASQVRDLTESVAKVREDVARIPTKEDLAGAVRDLTAALDRMDKRYTEAMVGVHKRMDAHLEQHPRKEDL